ncbi:MAG: hypothetical protein HY720_02175 [Planctomycetes bacterium]|nr:hypothetical protein [Planctomycetota bacterium]
MDSGKRSIPARVALVIAVAGALAGLVLVFRAVPEDSEDLPAPSPGSSPGDGTVRADRPPAVNDPAPGAVPESDVAVLPGSEDPEESPPEDPALSIIRKLEATPPEDLDQLAYLLAELRDTGSPRAVEWFLDFLGELPSSWDARTQDDFRRLIARHLGILGDPRAIPALESLAAMEGTPYLGHLQDEYGEEYGEMVEMRSRFPDEARASLQQIEYLSRLKAAATEEERIEVHLDQLLRPDRLSGRISPNDELAKIGEKAVPIVLARLARSSPQDRVQLFGLLGGAMEPVVRAHPKARAMVERAAVEEAVRASDPEAAIAAFYVLEGISEDEDVLRAVRRFADALAPAVTGLQRNIHGDILDPQEGKLAGLQSQAEMTADTIELRIRIRGKSETERVPEYWWALERTGLQDEAQTKLMDIGEPASAYLLERVRAGEVDPRRFGPTINVLSAIYIQRNGDESALRALLYLAGDADLKVAEAAVGALNSTWSPEALTAVRNVVGSLDALQRFRQLSHREDGLLDAARRTEKDIIRNIAERENQEREGDQK